MVFGETVVISSIIPLLSDPLCTDSIRPVRAHPPTLSVAKPAAPGKSGCVPSGQARSQNAKSAAMPNLPVIVLVQYCAVTKLSIHLYNADVICCTLLKT